MALRLIKPGTARAAHVRQFFFDEDVALSPGAAPLMPLPEAASADVEKESSIQPMLEPDVDIAALEAAAYGKGYAEGQKEGRALAEQALKPLMDRYMSAIAEISSLKSGLYVQAEREVVQLALAVAKKIVHREIRLDPDIIQTLVRVALDHVSEKSSVTLHVHPMDYAHLQQRHAELLQAEGKDIVLVADNSLQQGGCLIKTECGDIDARIEEKFREVERAFFEGSR